MRGRASAWSRRRPGEALAECGKQEATLALLGNPDADLTAGMLRRIFERFGDQADARSALLARPDLPASLHAEIVFGDGEGSARLLHRDGMAR